MQVVYVISITSPHVTLYVTNTYLNQFNNLKMTGT